MQMFILSWFCFLAAARSIDSLGLLHGLGSDDCWNDSNVPQSRTSLHADHSGLYCYCDGSCTLSSLLMWLLSDG